jgi:hypothetical protein
MVGANHLVAVGYICARANKQCAVIGHVLQEIVIIGGHDLHMFAGDFVSLNTCFFKTVYENNLTIISPRDAGDIGRLQRF